MDQTFGDFKKFTCWENILKLTPSTPNCMIYKEVGKLPLQVSVDKQIIAHWFRVLNKDVHTFAYMVYMIALNCFAEMDINHNG